jgi:multiple antibiotic resistance protein
MTLFWIAISLFLVMDSVGNIPLYMSILKDIPHKRQFIIIFREMVIALFVIILFNFAGDGLLRLLHIHPQTVEIAGGLILFLLSLKMIFPSEQENESSYKKIKEPFIVPLAIPLVAGPAVLATVMLFSRKVDNSFIMISAIFLSWVASLLILLASPFLSNILKEKGLMALERLMGFILVLLSVEMFVNGVLGFSAQK